MYFQYCFRYLFSQLLDLDKLKIELYGILELIMYINVHINVHFQINYYLTLYGMNTISILFLLQKRLNCLHNPIKNIY